MYLLLSNNDVVVPVDGIIRRCVETRTICSIEGAFLLLMRVDFNWDKSSRAPCQTSTVQDGTSRAPSAADAQCTERGSDGSGLGSRATGAMGPRVRVRSRVCAPCQRGTSRRRDLPANLPPALYRG